MSGTAVEAVDVTDVGGSRVGGTSGDAGRPAGARPDFDRTLDAGAPAGPRPRSGGRGRLARHARDPFAALRAAGPLAVAEVADPADRVVLAVLRSAPLADLDACQVAARAALTPTAAAVVLDRLVRAGLARDVVVAGRPRFGLP